MDNTKTVLVGNLNSEYSNFKNHIIQSLNIDNKDSLYANFVERLFSYVPEHYLNDFELSYFNNIAEASFSFFKKPHKKLPSVEILNISEESTMLFILNKDMPFIVDSILTLLSELSLEHSLILHPVIECKRDSQGNIELINSSDNNFESLVLIELDTKLDSESQENLKNKISHLLSTVLVTCDSWEKILKKISELKTYIESTIEEDKKKVISITDWVKTHDIPSFLGWIVNNNFTFLGLIEYNQNEQITELIGSRSSWHEENEQVEDIIKSSNQKINSQNPIIFGTVNTLSSIHRRKVVSYIIIKKFDLNKKYVGGVMILGLYGSGLQYQSIENIPILNNKLEQIINQSEFTKNGYNAKKIKLIVESLPRDSLFEIEQENLHIMAINILSAMATKNLKLFFHNNLSKQFINIFIFLPSDRMTPITHMNILKYFIEKFECNIVSDIVKEIVESYSYLKISIKLPEPLESHLNYEELELELDNISRLWEDSFIKEVNKSKNLRYSKSTIKAFSKSLPYVYQSKISAKSAIYDIQQLLSLSDTYKEIFKLSNIRENFYSLKIYSVNEIKLSSIIPIIECLGFKVIDEEKFDIENLQKFQICLFNLEGPEAKAILEEVTFQKLEDALFRISEGIMPKDNICRLIIYADFTWREVMIIKALTSYLRQIGVTYDYNDIQECLVKHHIFTKYLFHIFDKKLNPNNDEDVKLTKDNLLNYLSSVSSANEDKILNFMISIVEAIVRTNNYQKNNGDYKDYVSFKIDSHKVLGLPLPKPLVEIFVYSNDFEGIHLRGGRVARGGLRWSDRGSDYRTEILGLMKAQMTKNTVIVPVGSKGGFFIKKDLSKLDKQAFMDEVINCYKTFLKGLLDITDNVIDQKVITPPDTKILDNQDPYLVVAADKGTASFSDYANSVSKEYNFWLDDAFASGGSAGYDHKKLAITAKGAWIAVARHFMEMGIDVQNDSITMVGIGDMSGDVFGNGLLRSDKVKLVAAFNHRHIFIDPNPDPLISFKERERLFTLSASNWTDYDMKLLSKGGGIFERSAKSIELSNEIKILLDIDKESLSPEELIRYILKANVDLIWNGGIGTYIKSSAQSHSDIGDKSNDNLRINGNEVRAKVIGEGGNLGVSQLGRIEYSKNGGRINTDFIDNSAGVGCSDSEVNIKIALSSALKSRKITLEERNILLKQMTDEVSAKVLQANIDQTLALTIFEKSNSFTVESFSKLIDRLEQFHGLDREVEYLPSQKELEIREKNGEKLTRPELSVLLAYSKIAIANQLEKSNISDDPYLEKYLIEYFPNQMREKFLPEIQSHQLRKQIIDTVITNKIINQLTGTVINTIQEQTNSNITYIVKYFIVISSIFKTDEIWEEIESLPASVSIDVKMEMLSEINKLMRRGISWLIANNRNESSISQLIAEYENQVSHISSLVSNSLFGTVQDKYQSRLENFINNGINKDLAHKISILDSFISIFDIIMIAKSENVNPDNIAKIYFLVGDRLYLDFLRRNTESLIDSSYWKRLSVQSIKDDIYDMQRIVIRYIVRSTNNLTETFDNWFENNQIKLSTYLDFINDILKTGNFNINIAILASKKFRNYLKDLY